MFKTKRFVIPAVLLALALVLGGCAQPLAPSSPSPLPAPTPMPTPTPSPSPAPISGTGSVEVYVTDAPPGDDVTGIMVTVSDVKIHRSEAGQETDQHQTSQGSQDQEQEQTQSGDGEWITIHLDNESSTFDLLQVKGLEHLIGSSAEIPEGQYTQVRLVVEKAQVKLGDGDFQDATVPSGELKITQPFDVANGEITALVLDFDAGSMVNVTGSDKIIVKPVVKLTSRQQTKAQQETSDEETNALSIVVSCDEFSANNHITREIEMPVGRSMKLTLCSNPTTGFQWEDAKISDTSVLQQVDRQFKGSEDKGLAGAPGKEVWTFKALKEGEATISMAYSRPWEGGEKGTWTFELDVTVK